MTDVAWEAMVDEQTTITTLTAAEQLGIDVVEVYRMIDDGRLTASWDGKRLVVPVAEIEPLLHSTS